MKNTADITIIGGGIIGLLIAKELNKAGASITIVEKNPAAQESSWAGGGILLPLYPWRQAQAITELVISSLKIYPAVAEELFNSTGIDPEWTDCGLLVTKNPDNDLAEQWCQNNNIAYAAADTETLTPFQTQAVNPLWLPTIAQARNPRLLRSLRTFLQQQGVVFIENCTVTEIVKKNNRIEGIKTNTGTLEVNHLIIAAGAWTADLSKSVFPQKLFGKSLKRPQIFPVKGQMLLFQALPDTLPFMVLDDDCYLIPRRDGKILAGSTVEHSGFDKSTTDSSKNKLKSFAFELFPTLRNFFLLAHWAGLRPGTKEGIPYIDNHPEIENLSINAGHFRNGLTMAPASAQLMADLILKRAPSIDPKPYQLTRSE